MESGGPVQVDVGADAGHAAAGVADLGAGEDELGLAAMVAGGRNQEGEGAPV